MLKPAFAYLRVSGKDQVKGDGFTRQLLAIESWAAGNGYEITEVFREEGVTGEMEGMDRPAWARMIARTDRSSVVIIECLNRLARELMVQETIVAQAQKSGLTLLSTNEDDLCSTDPTRVMWRQIMGSVAQYDKSQIVAKLRGARERMKAKTGHCEGAKPYGVLTGEAEILLQMRDLAAAGLSLNSIVERLNLSGIRPRRGRQWYPMTVSRILGRLINTRTSISTSGQL